MQIFINEINAPDHFHADISELEDYPPRIVIQFSPLDQRPSSAVLNVTGVNTKLSFSITNECELLPSIIYFKNSFFAGILGLPKVDTSDLVVMTEHS